VTLKANKDLNIVGSQVGSEQGDVALSAKIVNIVAATNLEYETNASLDINANMDLTGPVPVPPPFSLMYSKINGSMKGKFNTTIKVDHQASKIEAKHGSLKINANATTVAGSNLNAKNIDIKTNSLAVISLHDIELELKGSTKAKMNSSLINIHQKGKPSSIKLYPFKAEGNGTLKVSNPASIIGSNSVKIQSNVLTNYGGVIAQIDESGKEGGNLHIKSNLIIYKDAVEGTFESGKLSMSMEDVIDGVQNDTLTDKITKKLDDEFGYTQTPPTAEEIINKVQNGTPVNQIIEEIEIIPQKLRDKMTITGSQKAVIGNGVIEGIEVGDVNREIESAPDPDIED